MKKTLFLIALIFTVNFNAQIVNIPDANFKNYLISTVNINLNLDGEIQWSEAASYTGGIYCYYDDISDLTGIEAFTAITTLSCGNNLLTSLDVSHNTAIISLSCGFNQLTTLDLSFNTALIGLWCENNQLTSLDVSNNTVLTGVICDNNQLECLNVKNGNNSNFSYDYLHAEGNINLTCIQVDDVNLTTFWSYIDTQTSFSTDCGFCTAGLDALSISPKQLVRTIDFLGRETEFKTNTPIIYLYSDGTTEKVFKFE